MPLGWEKRSHRAAIFAQSNPLPKACISPRLCFHFCGVCVLKNFPVAPWLPGLLAILATIVIYFFCGSANFFDQDCYTRLNLVEQFYQTGNWYDNVLPRNNPPTPETTQWSRLLDVVILSGGWVLGKFIGIKAGIFWWGAILNPLFLALGCVTVVWAGKWLLADKARMLAALLYVLQPLVITYSMFGRPDHHGLLILLMMLSLGGMVSLLASPECKPRTALWAAWWQSLAMAISVEALVSTAVSYFVLGILWLANSPHSARKAVWYSAGIAVWSLLLYTVHVPLSRWNTQELDRVSLVHLAVFFMVGAFWLIVSRGAWTKLHRLILAVAGGAATLGVAQALNPKFILGPTANIDPLLMQIWFSKIQEYHPLWPPLAGFPGMVMLLLFSSLLGIPWAVWQIKQSAPALRPAWIYLGILCLVFFLLSIVQVRWALYAEAVAVIPLAGFICFAADKLSAKVRPKLARLTYCGIIVVLATCNLPLGAWLLPKNSVINNHPTAIRQLPALCAWMNSGPLAGTSQVIAAHCNFGSEIVYRTPFSVIATASHRNADGILYVYNLFTNQDLDSARQQLAQKHITLILITTSGVDIPKKDLPEQAFYRRLSRGALPDWLRPLPLPAELAKDFSLFQVLY